MLKKSEVGFTIINKNGKIKKVNSNFFINLILIFSILLIANFSLFLLYYNEKDSKISLEHEILLKDLKLSQLEKKYTEAIEKIQSQEETLNAINASFESLEKTLADYLDLESKK